MTNEEIILLIRSGELDRNEGLEKLYFQNKKLIWKVVKPFFGAMEEADVMQDAFIGLVKAVEDYDPDKGVLFMTYASYWIRQHVARRTEDISGLIRIPSCALNRLKKYRFFVATYKRNHDNCDPDDSIVLEELKLNLEQLEELKRISNQVCDLYSLDSTISGEKNEDTLKTLGDSIADDFNLENEVIEDIFVKERNETLWKCVDALPIAQREILRKRSEGMSLREIGKELGVSYECIRVKEKKGIEALKNDERIQAIADDDSFIHDNSKAYNDGYAHFKNRGCSMVEEMVVRSEDKKARRIKRLLNRAEVI